MCWSHGINRKTALFQNRIAYNAVILIFCSSKNIWFVDLTKYIWEIYRVIIWNLFRFFVTSLRSLVLNCVWFLQESSFVERWGQSIGIHEHILFWIIHIDNVIGFFNRIDEIILLFVSLSEIWIISQKIIFAIFFDCQSEFFGEWNIKFNCLILVLLLAIKVIFDFHHDSIGSRWRRVEVEIVIKVFIVEEATGVIHSIHIEYWWALFLQI